MLPKKTVHYFQTEKMTIFNPSQAPLHIDGEAAETSEYFEIAVLPKAFHLLQPKLKISAGTSF